MKRRAKANLEQLARREHHLKRRLRELHSSWHPEPGEEQSYLQLRDSLKAQLDDVQRQARELASGQREPVQRAFFGSGFLGRGDVMLSDEEAARLGRRTSDVC